MCGSAYCTGLSGHDCVARSSHRADGARTLHTPQTSFIYGLTTCLLLNLHVVKSLEQMGFSTSRSLEISIDQIYYGGRYLAKKNRALSPQTELKTILQVRGAGRDSSGVLARGGI